MKNIILLAVLLFCSFGCSLVVPESIQINDQRAYRNLGLVGVGYPQFKSYADVINDFDQQNSAVWKQWLVVVGKIRPEANSFSWRRQGMTGFGIASNIAAVTLLAASPANIPVATGLAAGGTGILTFQSANDAEGFTRQALLAAAVKSESNFMEAADNYADSASEMDALLSNVIAIYEQERNLNEQISEIQKVYNSFNGGTPPEIKEQYRKQIEEFVEYRVNVTANKRRLETVFPELWAVNTQKASKSLNRMKMIAARGIVTEASDEDMRRVEKEVLELKEQLKKIAAPGSVGLGG